MTKSVLATPAGTPTGFAGSKQELWDSTLWGKKAKASDVVRNRRISSIIFYFNYNPLIQMLNYLLT